jgi:hypothetical protein
VVKQIKKTEMERACSTVGKKKGACRVLLGKPEGRRPLERPRSRWENYIKTDLREMGCGAWTGLARLRRRTVGKLL